MYKSILYSIPYVNELLSSPRIKPYLDRLQPGTVYATIRGVIDDISREMRTAASEWRAPDLTELVEKIVVRLQTLAADKVAVMLDGRGVLFPTQGTQLAQKVVEEMVWAIDTSLPPDPAGVATVLCRLTGAEAAIVFASPFVAKLAVIKAFCSSKDAVLARSDLYDDGNGTRLEHIFKLAGARFVEVGACNAVTFDDYAGACSETTGMVYSTAGRHNNLESSLNAANGKRVHELAERFGFPIVCERDFVPLVDLSAWCDDPPPSASEILKQDCDLLIFSGAQLAGGPDCGLLVGNKEMVETVRRVGFESLMPVHRIDLAGCLKTLRLTQDQENITATIPILRLLSVSPANLRNRAGRIAEQIESCPYVNQVEVVPGFSALYAGDKRERFPSILLKILPRSKTPAELTHLLEAARPGLYARCDDQHVTIDLRTVAPRHDALLVEIFDSFAEPGKRKTATLGTAATTVTATDSRMPDDGIDREYPQ